MPFKIVRNDITKVKADVIVNTANPKPVIGYGTDSAVYTAAGEKELLAERLKIGDIAPGNVAVTPAFNLPAKHIIHTVGPVWLDGNHGERDILQSCYARSMALAADLKAKSIAFPMIATGVYGFPKDEALSIAVSEISDFLLSHDMDVILVVFDRKSFELSGRLMCEIDEYIDEHGVGMVKKAEYGGGDGWERRRELIQARRRRADAEMMQGELSKPFLLDDLSEEMATLPKASEPAGNTYISDIDIKGKSLDEILGKTEKSFQDKLMDLIIASGMEDKEIYRAANMERKLYSSIRCKKDHVPKKKNILALAIGLKLDMSAMKDLLASAGYALSPNDTTDLIVSYYVENGKYNIFDLNITLYDYGQAPLGNDSVA